MNLNEFNEMNDNSDLFLNSKNIINSFQKKAYQEINKALIHQNWLIGYRIAEELKDINSIERERIIISKISDELTNEYGKGYTKTNLYSYYSFYKMYPKLFHTKISMPLLSWAHYQILIQVKDDKVRNWYEKKAIEEHWNVRSLQCNISSQYYYRLLKSQVKELVIEEMKQLTSRYHYDKLEFIKNLVIAEFLSLPANTSYIETDLKTCIISNLQKFLMELGKGYAFVARQQHIHTEKQDYFIDLVFYNYYLKCFVLIDLKTEKVTHQDVGQMDMYVRMYDELKRTKGDNPTIGIILCSETDEDIARYSILKGNEQLFASKYKLYLPSDEELRAEIESQKTIYKLQNM